MPHFGTRSKTGLDTLDHRLIEVLEEAIKHVDFSIICGHRKKEDQDAAFDAGKSRKRWPDGTHNTLPSCAVDVAPWPINWEDSESFYLLAGVIKGIALTMGYKLRLGGDWDGDGSTDDQTLIDPGHIEILDG